MSHDFHIGVQPPRSGRGGFTLIELLVVIAIIAILIALLIPSLGKAKELARRAVCASQQRTIAMASFTFASEHKSYLPIGSAGGWNYEAKYNPRDANGRIIKRPDGYASVEDFEDAKELPIRNLWPFRRYEYGVVSYPNPNGQGYLDDKQLMQCPSRTDHMPPSMGHQVVAAKMYNDFWSTYHFSGGSAVLNINSWKTMGQTDGEYSQGDFIYRTRLDLQESDQPLLSDMLIPNDEQERHWNWLLQTNHWVPGRGPMGSNIASIDGSTRWAPYNAQKITPYVSSDIYGHAGYAWKHYHDPDWLVWNPYGDHEYGYFGSSSIPVKNKVPIKTYPYGDWGAPPERDWGYYFAGSSAPFGNGRQHVGTANYFYKGGAYYTPARGTLTTNPYYKAWLDREK